MLTPFSGLALIIHLMVVGLRKITEAVYPKHSRTAAPKLRDNRTRIRRHIYSFLVLNIVCSVMLVSLGLTLHAALVARSVGWWDADPAGAIFLTLLMSMIWAINISLLVSLKRKRQISFAGKELLLN